MIVDASVLQHHIHYSVWANRRLLIAVGGLTSDQLTKDFGTADKSIAGTVIHLFRSERIWLARVKGEGDGMTFASPNETDFFYVTKEWPRIQEEWIRWAGGLTDADPERPIAYHDLKGRPWTNSLWHISLHVVNHSTHHRGQISGFIRALGKVPPPLDFIAHVRENSPAA